MGVSYRTKLSLTRTPHYLLVMGLRLPLSGFYALFSVTESPMVESGDRWMGFHWKNGGDQLYARTGSLPQVEDGASGSLTGAPWTRFSINLRNPTPLEGPMDFMR